MAVLHGWRLCPRCGAELDLGLAPGRVSCPSCGFVAYANPKPAANALVVDGDGRVLLTRRACEPSLGLWDLPGGFVEEGEHPLDTLRRELLEETGLVIELGVLRGPLDGRVRRRARRRVDSLSLLGSSGRLGRRPPC